MTEEFSMLIRINGEIPVEIQKLTGITEQELQSMGRPLEEVLEKLFEFAGNRIIVGHNVAFYYRNLLGGLYRENLVKSRNYEAVKSSKKWENVGNSYIIPALLLYRYSYI